MKACNLRNMPEELHRRIKLKAAEHGVTMQDLIIELLELGLKQV